MTEHVWALIVLGLILLLPWRRVRTIRWGKAKINFDPEAPSKHEAPAPPAPQALVSRKLSKARRDVSSITPLRARLVGAGRTP
jgi:hypothetical protein